MVKKNKKPEKLNGMELESTGSAPAETSGKSADANSGSLANAVDRPAEQQTPTAIENESSSENLLDDVRRALIEEEETDRNKKEAKWWRRIGRKDKNAESELPPPADEIDLPATSFQTEILDDQTHTTMPPEYTEQIDELIDILESKQSEVDAETSSVTVDVEIPPEPEPEIDFEQLKEQAFRPRSAKEAESESDVRSITLEDGEEVFVEIEAEVSDPFEERLKAFENALKPYRNYIYMTFVFLGVGMAVVASLIIFNILQRSRPAPTEEISNLPHPVAVSLPGGWSFNLGRGTLQGGNWKPSGAEWLEGTEVCRWVSLPWSRQLEAVLRTLNPTDPIELVMSNNDKLIYGVYSVYEMTPEEIQALDDSSPCLLLMLTGSDSEKRWVLTALP